MFLHHWEDVSPLWKIASGPVLPADKYIWKDHLLQKTVSCGAESFAVSSCLQGNPIGLIEDEV